MKFKIDTNLKKIAKAVGRDPEIVRFELCERYVNAGMIVDDFMLYNESFATATKDENAFKVCDIFRDYLGVDFIPAPLFDALCNLVVMGGGDGECYCPECGGRFEEKERIYRTISPQTYEYPEEYEIIGYIYECPICGEKLETTEEL